MPESNDDELAGGKNVESQLLPFFWGLIAVLFFGISAWMASGKDSLWTFVLFSLPVLAQVVGCAILWHRLNVNTHRSNVSYYRLNLFATCACVISYCVLWILYPTLTAAKYCQSHPALFQAVSIVALLLICTLLFLVAIMTSAFVMSAPRNPTSRLGRHCGALRNGIRDEPLWAIALFFILFLGVSYLFGFALAYHDQYALWSDRELPMEDRRPALRMANLRSIDDPESQPTPSPSPKPTSPNATQRQVDPSTTVANSSTDSKVIEGPFYFYFKDGEADLKTRTYAKCTVSRPPERVDDSPPKPEGFNDCALRALTNRIETETKDDKRLRVFLIGHTSSEPIGRDSNSQSFFSNYELSEARAQSVKFQALRMFKGERWRNVEWTIWPSANEPVKEVAQGLLKKEWFPDEELKSRLNVKDTDASTVTDIEEHYSADEIFEKLGKRMNRAQWSQELRVVAAVVKPVSDHVTTLQVTEIRQSEHQSHYKPLALIDYMYFSIYTITTTGYGDIIPTTAYAKFVTSLANVCEVLFLVVFFNALISIKGDRKEEDISELIGLIKKQNRKSDEKTAVDSTVRKFGRPERGEG